MAEMAVGYRALRERYTSRVILDPAARTIDVVAIEGPFRVLENHWRFTPEGEGTQSGFPRRLRILQPAAAGGRRPRPSRKCLLKMTDAFEARAASLSRSEA